MACLVETYTQVSLEPYLFLEWCHKNSCLSQKNIFVVDLIILAVKCWKLFTLPIYLLGLEGCMVVLPLGKDYRPSLIL